MSEPSNANANASNGTAAESAENHASEPGGAPAEAKASAAAKLAAHPKVKQALSYAKEHPLGAVVTVAAAAALVEVEFAVGILTGLGATALLAKRSGPQARDEVIARGREAIAKARGAIEQRKGAMAERQKARAAAPAAKGEASAPPPAA
ncbi:MAG TPA: hypothetical protein VMG12_19265 [Polyangiaceae bacterium]|nr:hypothetical protein [Polyangiaceae bacterium]